MQSLKAGLGLEDSLPSWLLCAVSKLVLPVERRLVFLCWSLRVAWASSYNGVWSSKTNSLTLRERRGGGGRRGWEGRNCKPGRKSSQKAVTTIQDKGQSGLDQITAMGMERGEELDGSFEAPATLVAATLGHQPAIPIIHRNQSHSVETQIKLVHSNGWRA